MKVVSKSVQVLLNGIAAAMVLTCTDFDNSEIVNPVEGTTFGVGVEPGTLVESVRGS